MPLNIQVKITYGDDKSETFACTDFPSTGEYIILYDGLNRKYLRSAMVMKMDVRVKKSPSR